MAIRLFQGDLEQALELGRPRLGWKTGDIFTNSATEDIYVYDGSCWSKLGGSKQDRKFLKHLIQEQI